MIYKQIIRIAIGEKGEPLLKVIDSCNEVCLKVISTVMYFTQIGRASCRERVYVLV